MQKKINLEVTVPTNNVKKKKRKRRKRKKKSKTSNAEHDILDEEDDNENVNDPDKKFSGQYDDNPDHDIVLQDLKTQCSAYGEISECSLATSGHAFVHFEEV